MLKITVEQIKYGIGPAKVIAEGTIFNDNTGTEGLSNYDSRFVEILEPSTTATPGTTTSRVLSGRVSGFDSTKLSALNLVAKALNAALVNYPHLIVTGAPYKVVNGEMQGVEDEWFVMVKDEDGHDYVVPASKKAEWYVRLEESSVFNDFEVPAWADRIDGKFKFKDYEHG